MVLTWALSNALSDRRLFMRLFNGLDNCLAIRPSQSCRKRSLHKRPERNALHCGLDLGSTIDDWIDRVNIEDCFVGSLRHIDRMIALRARRIKQQLIQALGAGGVLALNAAMLTH